MLSHREATGSLLPSCTRWLCRLAEEGFATSASHTVVSEKQPGRFPELSIPVLWFSGVLLYIQQLVNDFWALHPLSDQEKDGHHAAHLVVEECLSGHLKLA